jgi:hypothetical protein
MKYLKYFLAIFLVGFFALNSSYAILGETNDTFRSTGNNTNITINFAGQTKWVDWMEGGSGGGGTNGFLRLYIVDTGLGTPPYVQVYNNTQFWFDFYMTAGETAHFYVKEYQNGPLQRQVDIQDNNPSSFFSKAQYTFNQPGCSQTVQKVQLVQSSVSTPWVDRYVGAIFTKYSSCTQTVLVI